MFTKLLDAFTTRDSKAWLWTMAGAIVFYLYNEPSPPTEWSYHTWMQFLSMIVVGGAGKVSWSPLPLQSDKTEKRENEEIDKGVG